MTKDSVNFAYLITVVINPVYYYFVIVWLKYIMQLVDYKDIATAQQ